MDALLERVAAFLADRGWPAYVVGGAVRDRVLNRHRAGGDVDLAVTAPVVGIADELAAATGTTPVVMDSERGHLRLVLDGEAGEPPRWLDIAGGVDDIAADLARRDFTINAMAVPLARWDSQIEEAIIDPYGGRPDLRLRLVRETRPGNLVADPVRLLRAVRFAVQLGFAIEPRTAGVVGANAQLIKDCPGERLREEFFEIMSGPHPDQGVRLLDDARILEVLLPELTEGRAVEQPREHFYDVLEHQIRALEMAAAVLDSSSRSAHPFLAMAPWLAGFDSYFEEPAGDGQTRGTLLKTVALLHDVGKPRSKTLEPPSPGRPAGRIRFFGHDAMGAGLAAQFLARLRCSRRTVAHVSLMIEQHLRPSQMSAGWSPATDRAILRYFRDVSPVAVDTVFLNLCDYLAAVGPRLQQPDFERYAGMLGDILSRGLAPGTKPAGDDLLLDGHEVQDRFGLKPGPEIGRLLDALREEESSGSVRTKNEAYELLARLLGRAASRHGSP